MNFHDTKLFPFVQQLESRFPEIRKEIENQIETRFKPYAYSDVYTAGWTTLDLLYYDNRLNVRNLPRFTVSDCTDPMALFMVLLGAPDSFESRLLQSRLGEETMRELASYRSPHDCTPSMIDRLVGGMNALVFDPEFFVTHQDRLVPDGRFPRSRERFERLLASGRLVKREERFVLGDVGGDEGRDALRWFHVTLLEERLYPSFLKKGGMTEFKDVTSACPVTTSIVKAIPGLRSVWFSCLAPGAHIVSHTGNDATMLRCHLGLIVPEGCVMHVGSQLFSPNDFRHADALLELARPSNTGVPARLLREVLPADVLARLQALSSLEHPEDPDEAWKLQWAVAEALNQRVRQVGFYSSVQGQVRRAGATPVLDETVSRLRERGLLTAEGQVAPDATATEQGVEELEYLNTVFLIEAVYPRWLAKDPRVRKEAISWREGRCFVFDDTQYHEVWNRSQRNRVILNVDIEKSVYVR
ncbi:aspartyl/asparaginyl beta-hydroxylase domain-containing protein [Archangium primigenium]|uniref:aspartyl/asparaginyl beta-hydroxylase domain-containing protein n=1 Tax=Melittangium TaxID=44 RepID=UPI0019576842|nr:aspartyl/asparaginyl beta-hydroxylase domain-containing protein [Archangium primigenium]MBM7114474.1 aspartyl/asparaginyl beta-hydroxylase domain-containing protein [Archangium primigenium]